MLLDRVAAGGDAGAPCAGRGSRSCRSPRPPRRGRSGRARCSMQVARGLVAEQARVALTHAAPSLPVRLERGVGRRRRASARRARTASRPARAPELAELAVVLRRACGRRRPRATTSNRSRSTCRRAPAGVAMDAHDAAPPAARRSGSSTSSAHARLGILGAQELGGGERIEGVLELAAARERAASGRRPVPPGLVVDRSRSCRPPAGRSGRSVRAARTGARHPGRSSRARPAPAARPRRGPRRTSTSKPTGVRASARSPRTGGTGRGRRSSSLPLPRRRPRSDGGGISARSSASSASPSSRSHAPWRVGSACSLRSRSSRRNRA